MTSKKVLRLTLLNEATLESACRPEEFLQQLVASLAIDNLSTFIAILQRSQFTETPPCHYDFRHTRRLSGNMT